MDYKLKVKLQGYSRLGVPVL